MAEPTIAIEVNEGSEATPSWAAIVTALRVTGPNGIGDAWPAPAADGTDAFADDGAAPDDGEAWHDKTTPVQVEEFGRKANQNVIRANETGGTDGTADPPELTAYDDATDAGSRTAPSLWLLVGTAGSANVGLLRGIETESGAPGAGWTGQSHDSAPSAGSVLEGDVSKEAATSALAAGGSARWQAALANPHDATAGLSTWVWTIQYTYT